ncbi:hypothetical protein P7C73_g4635, partial [Tremellales sp. Uapishka_1]
MSNSKTTGTAETNPLKYENEYPCSCALAYEKYKERVSASRVNPSTAHTITLVACVTWAAESAADPNAPKLPSELLSELERTSPRSLPTAKAAWKRIYQDMKKKNGWGEPAPPQLQPTPTSTFEQTTFSPTLQLPAPSTFEQTTYSSRSSCMTSPELRKHNIDLQEKQKRRDREAEQSKQNYNLKVFKESKDTDPDYLEKWSALTKEQQSAYCGAYNSYQETERQAEKTSHSSGKSHSKLAKSHTTKQKKKK